jgi:hypothetical protein
MMGRHVLMSITHIQYRKRAELSIFHKISHHPIQDPKTKDEFPQKLTKPNLSSTTNNHQHPNNILAYWDTHTERGKITFINSRAKLDLTHSHQTLHVFWLFKLQVQLHQDEHEE